MTRSFAHFNLFWLSLLGLGVGACQAIAGIEERSLGQDSQQCEDYCAAVMRNCSGTNAVYNGVATCLGVCARLEAGSADEPAGDTLACRAQQAEYAEREPDVHCKSAGPGGNGVCGTDCEAYCNLYPKVCKSNYEYPSKSACLKACGGLPQQDSFDVVRDHGGDTIECRLVHLASSTTKPAEHCAHAPIPPTQPWCTDPADAAPTCEQYCDIELAACDGELTQYESPEQCLAVCGELLPGTNSDQTGNTVGCRRYHAFSATLDPKTHCYHSGPTGDGHCGDHGKVSDGHTGNCESYCRLLAAACPDEFDAEMGNADACMKACVELDEAAPDSEYTLERAKQSQALQCRVLYTARAFDDKAACASAVGKDSCK